MQHRILTVENEEDLALLRRVAKPVKKFQDPKITLAIQNMKRLAREWEIENGRRCAGLAATQCGINMRILIARKNDEMPPVKPPTSMLDENPDQYAINLEHYQEWMRVHGSTYDPWHVVINPKIVKCEDFFESEEGCLSIPGKIIKTVRPKITLFYYYDEAGQPVGTASKPLVAQMQSSAVITHETDHLNGTLATDNCLSVRDATDADSGVSL